MLSCYISGNIRTVRIPATATPLPASAPALRQRATRACGLRDARGWGVRSRRWSKAVTPTPGCDAHPLFILQFHSALYSDFPVHGSVAANSCRLSSCWCVVLSAWLASSSQSEARLLRMANGPSACLRARVEAGPARGLRFARRLRARRQAQSRVMISAADIVLRTAIAGLQGLGVALPPNHSRRRFRANPERAPNAAGHKARGSRQGQTRHQQRPMTVSTTVIGHCLRGQSSGDADGNVKGRRRFEIACKPAKT